MHLPCNAVCGVDPFFSLNPPEIPRSSAQQINACLMFWIMHSLQDTKCSRGVSCNEEPGVADQITPDIAHITPSHLAHTLSRRTQDVNKLGHLPSSSIFLQQLAELSRSSHREINYHISPAGHSAQILGCQATQLLRLRSASAIASGYLDCVKV